MQEISGVYEIAIPVKNLARAEAFYINVLGIEPGLFDARRRWHFLRIGAGGMIVLQEEPRAWRPLHFAFTTTPAEIDAAAAKLKESS